MASPLLKADGFQGYRILNRQTKINAAIITSPEEILNPLQNPYLLPSCPIVLNIIHIATPRILLFSLNSTFIHLSTQCLSPLR